MAKISSFADGGDPQAADEFVVARGGINLKVIWSAIEAYLDTLFSLAGTGVTGGDAHDHWGGDGAQISHTTLSAIGVNSHAEIDAYINAGATGEWTVNKKTADESKVSDTALAQDAVLKQTLTANKIYAFRGRIFFTTNTTADFKFRFVCAGTSFLIKYTSYPSGSVTGTVGKDVVSPGTTVSVICTGTTGGYIEFDGVVGIDGSDRVLSFQWAQNTSNVGATVVKEGSYLEYLLINP